MLSEADDEDHSFLLKGLFDNAAVGICLSDLEGNRIAVNDRYCEILGYTKTELTEITIPQSIHPDDVAGAMQRIRELAAGRAKSYQHELRCLRKTGEGHWIRVSVSLKPGSDRCAACVISIVESIDQRRRAEEAQALLIAELNHRVKNTLAIVQGLANEIKRRTRSTAEFLAAFETRLQSIARSHDLLTDFSWQPVPLEHIIAQVTAGERSRLAPQIAVDCPAVDLNAQTSVMLGLILNELFINATKHGALRTTAGHISVSGNVATQDRRPMLTLLWEETVDEPLEGVRAKGLGTYLVERGAKLGLGGAGRLEFFPWGMSCRLEFPVYASQMTSHRTLGPHTPR